MEGQRQHSFSLGAGVEHSSFVMTVTELELPGFSLQVLKTALGTG